MGRGKDGFDSLLVIPEGGKCPEIVSEENGVLISTIIRQFFMSLKVMGRWKQFGPSMVKHWDGVKKDMESHMSTEDPPRQDSKVTTAPLNAALLALQKSAPGNVKQAPGLKQPVFMPSGVNTPTGYDSDAEAGYDSDAVEVATSQPRKRFSELVNKAENADRTAMLVRRVLKKWRRVAGIGHGGAVDSIDEGEFEVPWTTSIAPRLEKRIVLVQE
jgi:5'-nucleotidase